MGQGFGLGGRGFVFPMLLALGLNLCVAVTFGELAGLVPRAGSLNHYTLAALGPFLGILAVVSGYVVVEVFAGSAEATIPGLIVNSVFLPDFPPKLIATIIVLILMWINIRGIEFYGWSQIFLTAAMILSLTIMGILGISGATTSAPLPETAQPFNPMGWGVLSLTALAFWLFVGVEFVTPLAEEIRQPQKLIPLAMITGLGTILVAKILFGFASLKYLPMQALAASPTPHVDAAGAMLGVAGGRWMAVVSILATISTLNTLICSIPRMLYGMAQQRQMPAVFARLHPSYRTPWAGIILISAAILTPALIGVSTIETIVIYILAACFSWFVAYIIGFLDLIILRIKYPSVPRPFRSPGWLIPQILGIAGMVYVMFNIHPEPALKVQIYRYALIFLGITAVWSCLWTKLVMRRGLFQTIPLNELSEEGPPPALTPQEFVPISKQL
jgi:amino acid transporter